MAALYTNQYQPATVEIIVDHEESIMARSFPATPVAPGGSGSLTQSAMKRRKASRMREVEIVDTDEPSGGGQTVQVLLTAATLQTTNLHKIHKIGEIIKSPDNPKFPYTIRCNDGTEYYLDE